MDIKKKFDNIFNVNVNISRMSRMKKIFWNFYFCLFILLLIIIYLYISKYNSIQENEIWFNLVENESNNEIMKNINREKEEVEEVPWYKIPWKLCISVIGTIMLIWLIISIILGGGGTGSSDNINMNETKTVSLTNNSNFSSDLEYSDKVLSNTKSDVAVNNEFEDINTMIEDLKNDIDFDILDYSFKNMEWDSLTHTSFANIIIDNFAELGFTDFNLIMNLIFFLFYFKTEFVQSLLWFFPDKFEVGMDFIDFKKNLLNLGFQSYLKSFDKVSDVLYNSFFFLIVYLQEYYMINFKNKQAFNLYQCQNTSLDKNLDLLFLDIWLKLDKDFETYTEIIKNLNIDVNPYSNLIVNSTVDLDLSIFGNNFNLDVFYENLNNNIKISQIAASHGFETIPYYSDFVNVLQFYENLFTEDDNKALQEFAKNAYHLEYLEFFLNCLYTARHLDVELKLKFIRIFINIFLVETNSFSWDGIIAQLNLEEQSKLNEYLALNYYRNFLNFFLNTDIIIQFQSSLILSSVRDEDSEFFMQLFLTYFGQYHQVGTLKYFINFFSNVAAEDYEDKFEDIIKSMIKNYNK